MVIDINPDRLLILLRALATFGGDEHGVTRVAYSPADIHARQWMVARLEEAGLDASMDRVGNVYGRNKKASRAILLGSHTDSVPRGGWLDGALGVIYALEIAFALRDQALDGLVGIDVIDFQDEEGAISPCLGSRAFCGELTEAGAMAMVPQQSAMVHMSGPPLMHRHELGRHLAYLEAHIEQGPKLEASDCTIGIVQGIVGIRRFCVHALGRSDHAGTTPMNMRRDAGRALFELAEHVHREFPRIAGRDSVWNIGNFSVQPGAANVVPGRAEMSVECRDLDDAVLDDLEASLRARAETLNACGLAEIEVERTIRISPEPMAQDMIALFERAAQRLQQKRLMLASGAGHDAMVVAKVMPAGMIFIPSIGGRSHSNAEDSTADDIISGCRVFASAVDELMFDRARMTARV